MKKILLIALSLTLSGIIQAGNLELYYDGNVVPNGSSVMVLGDPMDDIIQFRVGVKNISATALDVKVKKVIHDGDTLTGSTNYFCWGLCYGTDTYVSPYPVSIAPGVTNEDFYGDYSPHTQIGTSLVTYVFYDMNNTNDSIAVMVEYKASPASVTDPLADVKFSQAYPNPAMSLVNVDYTLPATFSRAEILITNMLGSRVKEVTLAENNGTVQIPVTDLMNGIYFYSLVGDEQVLLTRKFIVKK